MWGQISAWTLRSAATLSPKNPTSWKKSPTDLNVHAEICPHIEGWVDVDQLEAALLFDLLAQRAVLQAGEDELIVAPAEFVRPALELASAFVQIEQAQLQ